MKAHGSAVQADLAGGGARDTGERLHQLGASGAHQAVKAENFSLAQAEADMGKLGRMTEIGHLQHRFSGRAADFRVGLGDRPAHHHRHHPLFGDVAYRPGADVHPIAQDGVIIGQLEDFIELMRDKQDRFAVLLQTLNDVIKLQDFMLGKRGGRLIEDHHLGVESQRPGNRHHVTLGDAEGFQRGSRVDLDFQPGEDLVGSAVHRRPVERFQQSLIQILADENVFADREFVKQHGFLVNGGDPYLMRRLRRWQMNGDRFIEDLALFGLINTGHHFDQRGFPRAVFAD